MRFEEKMGSYPVESEEDMKIERSRELEKKTHAYNEMIASGTDEEIKELVMEMEQNSGKVLISCSEEKGGKRKLLFGDRLTINHEKGWDLGSWKKEVSEGAAS